MSKFPRKKKRFRRGSMLFFYASEEAASTDYTSEVTYALEEGSGGVRMKVRSAAPSRKLPKVQLSPYVRADYETNRWYQAGPRDSRVAQLMTASGARR